MVACVGETQSSGRRTAGEASAPTRLRVELGPRPLGQTYDVTDLLMAGEHTLTATVTDGWWRGSVGYNRNDRCYREALALLAATSG
jgi:hypothetical protein